MTTETERTVWTLAGMAGVASPDSLTSPGAEWLELVAAYLVGAAEELAEAVYPEDMIYEMADGLVPIYTHERWQVFVDLAAYTEDITDFGPIDDMEQAAGVALFMIAERLLTALVAEEE